MTPLPKGILKAMAVSALTAAAGTSMAFTHLPDGGGQIPGQDGDIPNDSVVIPSILEHIVNPANLIPGGHLVSKYSSAANDSSRYEGLTDEDFRIVAEELDVETAAIKAVVSIEAGNRMKGFWAPGIPIANFEPGLFTRYKAKVKSPGAKGEKVPEGLRGFALKEWTQLINARKVNAKAANMATFWGMFQIGGFNYSKCGCKDVDEFVKLMAFSELEQLELFAAFIANAGMADDLRNKNWAAFSRKYNGPGYAKRGYHTRMANAYKRFKAKETAGSADRQAAE